MVGGEHMSGAKGTSLQKALRNPIIGGCDIRHLELLVTSGRQIRTRTSAVMCASSASKVEESTEDEVAIRQYRIRRLDMHEVYPT